MIRLTLIATTAVLALGTWPGAAIADSLIVNNLNPQAAADARPDRGMSMTTVESRWGMPRLKRSAVGDPPISSWEYSNFVVYFEYANVIHAVAKNQ
jgi:hypothetical protein